MTTSRSRLAGVVFFLLAALAARVHAQVPELVPLHGVLTDATGRPLSGELQVVFALYAAAMGGESLYRETRTLSVEDGRFSVLLGENVALDPALFAQHRDVFLGVRVEDDAEAEPRMRLGTVPFAAAAEYAQEAATLEGVGASELQRRIVGSCDGGEAMVAIDADGSVRCEPFAAQVGPRGPEGPQGPEGPAGEPGPQGERGERGPAVSFDCGGLAVSKVDDDGRPTCIPRATTNVSAGEGLVSDDCAGNTCTLSVAPDGIGMAQVSLPMAFDHGYFPQLVSGVQFYLAGLEFVPETDGSCLVLASLEINGTAELTSGRLELRVGYTEDGAAGDRSWSVMAFVVPSEGLAAGSATQNQVIPVTAHHTYRFGCIANTTGSWVGQSAWCQITRLCQ